MEFQEIHKSFFNCEVGAFSKVTDRENYDSQITVTKEEKKIIDGLAMTCTPWI